ncbi:hypothetical protein JXQ70_01485 [bacterium]|nr:hypothetical protein [bacterium]
MTRERNKSPHYHLFYYILISVLIHFCVLAFMPGPDFSKGFELETYQVVSFVPFDENVLTAFSAERFSEHVDWLETLETVNEADLLNQTPRDQTTQSFFLPQTHFQKIDQSYEETIIEPILTDSLALTDDKLKLLPSAMAELPLDLEWHLPKDGEWLSTPVDKADQKIAPPSNDLPAPDQNTSNQDQIEGPVASRMVIFKPTLPTVSLETSMVITLKFWVFPDGTVGKIIPEKKANAELEQIAMNYLKQWRFTALPREVRQEEQWGVISIKFMVF